MHTKYFPSADITAGVFYDAIPFGYLTEADDQELESCIFLKGDCEPDYEVFGDAPSGIALSQVEPLVISETLTDLYKVISKAIPDESED